MCVSVWVCVFCRYVFSLSRLSLSLSLTLTHTADLLSRSLWVCRWNPGEARSIRAGPGPGDWARTGQGRAKDRAADAELESVPVVGRWAGGCLWV